jgi:hypothetical protein
VNPPNRDAVMSVYTIYERPPNPPVWPAYRFVVREFVIRPGQQPQATESAVWCDSLDGARHAVPPWAGVCCPRAPGDAPDIVESWM